MSEMEKALNDFRENFDVSVISQKYSDYEEEYCQVFDVLKKRLEQKDNNSWQEVELLNNIAFDMGNEAEYEAFKAGFLKGAEVGAGKVMAAMLAGGAK